MLLTAWRRRGEAQILALLAACLAVLAAIFVGLGFWWDTQPAGDIGFSFYTTLALGPAVASLLLAMLAAGISLRK